MGFKIKNGNYHEGVRFEDIVELYLFNANFRQIILVQIEKIEINLRCRLSNYFCKRYGVLGYEDINNFTVSDQYFYVLQSEMEKELIRNGKSPFIKNFKNHYEEGKMPLYAIIELFSFGTLSKFFKNMKSEDKKSIAALYSVSYTYFESWIENVAYVRNICAHYGRVYNAKFVKTPRLYNQYTEKGIKNLRIFATLLVMKHLLPHDRHWHDFIQTIELLIEKYSSVNLDFIGFPEDWMNYLR